MVDFPTPIYTKSITERIAKGRRGLPDGPTMATLSPGLIVNDRSLMSCTFGAYLSF
jgi:hypothetical protein